MKVRAAGARAGALAVVLSTTACAVDIREWVEPGDPRFARSALCPQHPDVAISAVTLGLSPANTPAQNRVALVSALSNASGSITFPPGDYALDNATPLVISAFEGKLVMETGARWVFSEPARRGLHFQGGVCAELHGVSTALAYAPTTAPAGSELLLFEDDTDTYLRDARVDRAASAGLTFVRSVRPVLDGAQISSAAGDGVAFGNCADPRAVGVRADSPGGIGLFVKNLESGVDRSGGVFRAVEVYDSGDHGIAVMGQSGVSVEDAQVARSGASGIRIYREGGPTGGRTPHDVLIRGGAVLAAGGHGVLIEHAGAGLVVEELTVTAAQLRGVTSIGSVALSVRGVTVEDTGQSGFDLSDGEISLHDCRALRTAAHGFYVGRAVLTYGELEAVNCSHTLSLRRAFSWEDNSVVQGGRLIVVDDQPTATGYTVASFGTQSGTFGDIHWRIPSGDLVLENNSGLLVGQVIELAGPARYSVSCQAAGEGGPGLSAWVGLVGLGLLRPGVRRLRRST